MKVNKNFNWLMKLSLIYVALLLVLSHIKTIEFPFPNEFREGHTYSSTSLLLNGINPYTLDAYPIYINSYGIIFNILVYPFAYIFGNSLVLHRLINGIFILSTIYIIFIPYLKQIKHIYYITIFTLLLYAGLIYGQSSTLRPDGMGTFFYIMTILIPIKNAFSNRSIIFSMFYAVISFYTKPIFLLGWIILSIYMFFFISKKKAFIWNAYFLVAFLVIAYGVYHIFPLYFYETLFSYSSSFGSIKYSFEQYLSFFRFITPILLLFIIFFVHTRKGNIIKILTNPYLILSLIVTIFLFYPLGVNPGAYLTYHLQLLLPLICLFFLSEDDMILTKFKSNPIILMAMALLLFCYVDITPSFKNTDQKDWIEITNYLKKKKNVLNSSIIAPLLIIENKSLYDNGVTGFVFEYKKSNISNFIFGLDDLVYQKKEAYIKNIEKQIENMEFDAIILNTSFDKELFSMIDTSKYYFERRMYLITPHDGAKWEIEIYEPRNDIIP